MEIWNVPEWEREQKQSLENVLCVTDVWESECGWSDVRNKVGEIVWAKSFKIIFKILFQI